ncbi:hypothetical protein ACIHAR_01335 [Streptomyces sp. NPDC052016]|uniref:hypothetical protein n=1 Tax=Streptomyces sp. NPDC052016 TaxID=3365680 RepID=UPI0037D21039
MKRTRTSLIAATVAALGALAQPAQAAANWTNWATFSAYSTNYASYGYLDYRYEATGGGWYKAEFSYANISDLKYGDGWGSVIRARYDTPQGARWGVVAQADDGDGDFNVGETYYNVKNMWFEVCNWDMSSGAMYSCARMYKSSS